MPKLNQRFSVYHIQSKEKFFTEKRVLKEKERGWRIEKKNEKKAF